MSTSFSIVNPAKRQYISPGSFGDFHGPSGYLEGRHAAAPALLRCDGQALGMGRPAGSWSSDRIPIAVAPPDRFGGLTSIPG